VVGNQSSFGGGGGEYTYMQFGDGFVARIAPGGKSLDYCAFVGGSADDVLFGVATDNNGNVYFAGSTVSGNLKTTPTAVQSKFAGTRYSRPSYVMGDAVYGVFTGFPAGTPVITEVANAEGESPAIAPNSWILIKGAALAASSRIWGNSDFANNQMPTALDNVIVTLNGEPAYVYYISGTQINALTPPDLAPGGVNVVVSVNGVPSAPFVAQVQPLSESFFVFNGGPYIAAVHLNGTLVGPPGLLGPAVLTTPAKPGEEISLYMNGFGPTNPAVTKGLQSQSGNLPTFPMVTIGGIQANVIFAALVSPGLFQFNIYLPSGLSNSDNQIKATYNGSTTQAGTLLTVQQ